MAKLTITVIAFTSMLHKAKRLKHKPVKS